MRYRSSPSVEGMLRRAFARELPVMLEDQSQRIDEIREVAARFADLIARTSPASREQGLALNAVDEAVLWAREAIVRNEHPLGGC